MRRSRRRCSRSPWSRGALAAGALLLASACSLPTPGRIVRIGHESKLPPALDPAIVPDATAASLLSNFFEGLAAFDGDMRVVPALAVGWVSLDDRTWLFELRDRVLFQDGTPLTALEVKRSLERARDAPGSTLARHLAGVRRIDVVDERHLRLVTENADPLLVDRLTHALIGRESRASGIQRFVGTGPYRPIRWGSKGTLEARAFGEYWHGAPPIEWVTFLSSDEPGRMREWAETGEVDALRWTGPAAGGRAGTTMRVISRPSLGRLYLWFNTGGGRANPLSDRRVRQAISLALDRKVLCSRLAGEAEPAGQLVPQGVFGHIPGLPDAAFDPGGARKLLQEAGYGHGLPATLTYVEGGSITSSTAEAIRSMLAAVDIRLQLDRREWRPVVEDWRGGRLAFLLSGWLFEDNDAYSFLADCIETRDAARGSGLYNVGYSNAALDESIRELARVFDADARLARFDRLMRAATEQAPLVPLCTPEISYAVSPRLKWRPRLDGELLAAEMSFSE
jgi:peptide/nickel transport system substrate-binding protein